MKKSIIAILSILLSFAGYTQNGNSDASFIIDKLINGEEYTIIVDTKGYGHYSDTIVISKSMDTYILQFNGNEHRLYGGDLNYIRDFEKNLYNCCSHFGCSEISNYRVAYKNELWTIKDTGCELDRISSLLKSLNIEYR